jgi:hypothetical protein
MLLGCSQAIGKRKTDIGKLRVGYYYGPYFASAEVRGLWHVTSKGNESKRDPKLQIGAALNWSRDGRYVIYLDEHHHSGQSHGRLMEEK